MTGADVCNITAWVLCVVVGGLLFGDFIRTELRFRREDKEQKEREEAQSHE